MATVELQTRLALKYDTYANWTNTATAGQGGNLVLLKGEIGLCEVPSGNAEATTAPTVLFKVGNGTSAFKDLKWASALAADVHAWAKAETVALTGTTLQFKTGGTVVHSVDLKTFATASALNDAVARIAAIEGSIGSGGNIANDIAVLNSRVDSVDAAYKAADKAINDKIGGSYSSTSTVASAIADAKAAGTTAQTQVTNLTNGAVKTNTADIAQLKSDLATETSNRTSADSALSGRLDKLEVFFAAADADGKDGGLYDALDTLVEIQEYITEHGEAADEMVKNISANANAIKSLQETVGSGGALEKRVAAAEADITQAKADITALNGATAGYSSTSTIKSAITAVDTKAGNAQTAATNAKTAADKAQGDVDALTAVVNNTTTGLAATKKIADTATSDIAALKTRVGTAETDIDALEAIVKTGTDSNANLRTAITALQTLTGDASKGNEKLRTDLTAITNTVNNATTGLAATKKIADDAKSQATTNKTDIAAIKADYLKAADVYIFNCGSASTVTHTA